MKTIKIDAENVTTLRELAKQLADMYGWKSYEVANHAVNFKEDVIYFKALGEDGKEVHGMIDTTGFAKDVVSGKPLDEWNVNWDEDFDAWSNHVWAKDKNGHTVMLHD